MNEHYGAGYVSECCGWPSDEDMGICFRCGEHCDFVEPEDEDDD